MMKSACHFRTYQKKLCKALLLAASLSLSFGTQAFTLNVNVKGENVSYSNATSIGGDAYVLSDWQAINNLEPTNNWQPGLFTTGEASFRVSGVGVTSFDIPLQITGIQYNLGNAGGNEDGTPLISGASCSRAELNGSIYSLNQSVSSGVGHSQGDCAADASITTENFVQPFYFIRPIFSFDTTALLSQLQAQEITQNTHLTGQVSLSAVYYYRTNAGIRTYRQLPIQSFVVQINYQPAELVSITADAVKEIIPEYDKSNHTAKGSVDFNIKAIGNFPSGLKMMLTPKPNFQMVKIADEDEAIEATRAIDIASNVIPYSITCSALCDVEQLVVDGQIRDEAESPIVVDGERASDFIDFNLTVSYEGIPAEDVTTGLYQDTFTVTFEENL